ncbi:tigger transposable element-derived protein 6-like [Ixodes scapularis]|uniref:tigger transposable element-derived protein 6-like n=1 Tax=Ixodes scapularis TaxID=6945 RepID=UPI001C38E148|nr:tigger transposable element-derived protein 6-like [Ixodes scapularis]
MEPPKKKRKVLTLEEKANIIRAVASGRKKCDVAAEHGIPASTLSTILKTKDAIILATSSGNGSKKKNLKTTPHEKLEEALFMWFNDMRARNVPLSGEVVQQKALNYACLLGFDEFKASPGWLSRFKERYGIVGKVSSGESSSVNKQGADEWLSENVPEILGRYAVQDVYNADESGLFYQMLPGKTLARKGEPCHGGKQSKQRLTLLLCVNMDGSDKRDPLIIGKAQNPRCFKGARKLSAEYVWNTKAWMSRAIFSEWLKRFDDDMGRQKRNVCLLLDNCTAHHIPELHLKNVELRFFPPNATSVIQPLDQGIINSVKCAYKRRVNEKLLLNLEIKRETKIDVYMAIEMVAASWRATRSSIVVNCFRHAGFHTSTSEAASGSTSPQHEQEEASPSCWEELRRRDQVAADQDFDDFVNANADANTDTTEVLDDEEIVQLVSGAQEKSEEAKGPDAIEAPVPTPSQVMDAVDLLRRFAGAHEGAEDALTSLASYEKCVRPLLTKRAQAKITSFFH